MVILLIVLVVFAAIAGVFLAFDGRVNNAYIAAANTMFFLSFF